jgi:hypothetical protein
VLPAVSEADISHVRFQSSHGGEYEFQICLLTLVILYKPPRYKSEVMRFWPQRCNTAKPTRCYNFPTSTVLTVARHSTVVVAVPFTVQHPANYKIEIYYLT